MANEINGINKTNDASGIGKIDKRYETSGDRIEKANDIILSICT